MSNYDFENDDHLNVSELIALYEQSVKEENTPFFDQEAYESIIDYYEERGQLDNAIDVAEKALLQYPYSAMLLVKKAQVCFEMKQLDTALEILDKAEIYDSSE